MLQRLLFCLFLLPAALHAQCDSSSVTLNLEDPRMVAAVAEVEELLAEQREALGVPALSAVLVYGTQTLLSAGYGVADLSTNRPATDRTVYHVGGLTKVFTATMLMKLRDEGKVHLDTPITELMSSYAVKGCPGEGPPTLVELASHLAGLPHAPAADYWTDGSSLTELDILKTLPDTRTFIGRQRQSHYSHLSYAILGHALSLAAGQPYNRYMWKQILQPLEMTDSAYAELPMIKPLLATGYVRGPEGLQPKPQRMLAGLDAAYGLMTSARDLGRFLTFQFGLRPNVLRPTSVREMQQPRYIFPDWQRAAGIGWLLYPQHGMTAVGHRGVPPGFSVELRMIPELQLGVALLTNLDFGDRWIGVTSTEGGPSTLGYKVLEILIPVVTELRTEQLQKLIVKPERDLAQYIGTFAPDRGHAFFKPIVVTEEDGHLMIYLKGVISPISHIEGDHFRIVSGESITFVRDETGQITGIRLNGGGFLFRKLRQQSTPAKPLTAL